MFCEIIVVERMSTVLVYVFFFASINEQTTDNNEIRREKSSKEEYLVFVCMNRKKERREEKGCKKKLNEKKRYQIDLMVVEVHSILFAQIKYAHLEIRRKQLLFENMFSATYCSIWCTRAYSCASTVPANFKDTTSSSITVYNFTSLHTHFVNFNQRKDHETHGYIPYINSFIKWTRGE